MGTSTLTSDITGGLITIDDASSLRLGQVNVAEGTLQIGGVGPPLGGAISQAGGTSITAAYLSVDADGDIDLSQVANSIGTVDRIDSRGSVDLHSDVSGRPGATMTVHQIETASGSVRGDIHVSVTGSVELVSSDLNNDNVLTTEMVKSVSSPAATFKSRTLWPATTTPQRITRSLPAVTMVAS